jgi:hypothetical protein
VRIERNVTCESASMATIRLPSGDHAGYRMLPTTFGGEFSVVICRRPEPSGRTAQASYAPVRFE